MLMAERVEGIERITLAGDKGYDTKDFVSEMRGMNVTPHVAQNHKRPAGARLMDARRGMRDTRSVSGNVSGSKKFRLDEDGWDATQNPASRAGAVRWVFTFTAAAYNLVRMRNLMSPAVQSV